MDYSSIKSGLEGFVERYDSQTFLGSYRETSRSSLLNDGLSTRANALWKMAEYVVAKHDNTDNAINKYITGWKQLASGANNQFLLLEEERGAWGMYDSQGNRLGGDDYIQAFFDKKRKQQGSANNTSKGDANNEVLPRQQIYYGAPGTGKSHEINRLTEGKNVVRTTFHPDSDYSTFVGAYKPSMKPTGVTLASGEREEVITYKFVPQAFTRAYVEAWKTTNEVYLVIEEINRGNCAQIFGDLFQLLDRKDGVSEYPVEADTDLAAYLSEALAGSQREDIPLDVQSGRKLVLPLNLYIWATMNTSDQSLFPIDSAFKRRWEWKYIPIDTKKEAWSIAVDGVNYSWTSFLEIVNECVFRATSSEDKQLGFYFCKAQNNVVSAETFVSKVLFYLWNDVFKDYDEGESIFKDAESAPLPFSKFYKTNGNVDTSMVDKLLTALKVENDKKADASGEAEEA